MSVCIDNINFGPEILQSDILEITKFLLNLVVILMLKHKIGHFYTVTLLNFLPTYATDAYNLPYILTYLILRISFTMVYDKNYDFLKDALSGHAICKGKNEYDGLIHKEVTSIIKY